MSNYLLADFLILMKFFFYLRYYFLFLKFEIYFDNLYFYDYY